MKNYAPVYQIVNLLLVLAFISGCQSKGVNLTIKNHDSVTIDSLEVHVTGNSYSLGSLASGETVSVPVQATGDSHIELSHSKKQSLLVDVYLEPGYRGFINVEIIADSVLSVESKIKIGPLPLYSSLLKD